VTGKAETTAKNPRISIAYISLLLRHASAPVRRHEPIARVATGPNQVWNWNIILLTSSMRGMFFYVYLIVDAIGNVG